MSVQFTPKINVRSRSQSAELLDVEPEHYHKKLSKFQVEKLTFFFTQFFDKNQEGKISDCSVEVLNERLKIISGWEDSNPLYLAMADNNRVFMECLLEQARLEARSSLPDSELQSRTWEEALAPRKLRQRDVTLDAWLNMWGKLCSVSTGMGDFPVWVKLIPDIVFSAMVAKEGSKFITLQSLKNFYRDFSGLPEDSIDTIAEDGFKTMTANREYEITLDHYRLLFSNFLLGKTLYGPGKYIFGCFDNRELTEPFPIVFD